MMKIFKDPIWGYIEVEEDLVKLIDSFEMQRIKDIPQAGLNSVYNAANHNRFSHSLGVYHLGKNAYEKFRVNVQKYLGASIKTVILIK